MLITHMTALNEFIPRFLSRVVAQTRENSNYSYSYTQNSGQKVPKVVPLSGFYVTHGEQREKEYTYLEIHFSFN